MASASENTGFPSPFPNSPQVSSPAHRNRLTQCFDDILRVASEMMVQQQLKTVQLDSSVVNGFSQTQQKLLREKVHTFHTILDDLESTLSNSKVYVQSVYDIGVEKEKRREKEREELRRRQEQEEARKKEEEAKRAQEEEQLRQIQQQEQSRGSNQIGTSGSGPKLEFSMDPSNGLGADFGNNNPDIDIAGVLTAKDIPMNSPAELNAEPQSSQYIRQFSPNQTPKQEQQPQQSSANDLGMNMSILSGLENGGLDMNDFNSRISEPKDKNDINANIPPTDTFQRSTDNNNGVAASNDVPIGNNLGDNDDDYLTLNDFNDFNIDWNNTGNPGDLDLNAFNI